MPRREDHEVHKGHVVALEKEKLNFVGVFYMFRTRRFIFRKTVVYTGMVWYV